VNLPTLDQMRRFDFAARSLLDNFDRSDKWFETDVSDVEVWVVHFPSVAKMDGRTLSTQEYDAKLRDYDEYIGKLLAEWTTFRPRGYVVVAGVTGSLNGARDDAALGLTDDILRVPLIVQGPNVEADWEVTEVVSTVDVAATIGELLDVPLNGHGQYLMSGGSTLAYHESTYGYERFNTRPMVGYTEASGRYAEGVYGRWYPASKDSVAPFELPVSEYAEQAEVLKQLRAEFGPDQGLPGEAWTLQSDVRDSVRLDSLATKLELAIAGGRLPAAKRMFNRLRASAPSAPIVKDLEARLQKASAKLAE